MHLLLRCHSLAFKTWIAVEISRQLVPCRLARPDDLEDIKFRNAQSGERPLRSPLIAEHHVGRLWLSNLPATRASRSLFAHHPQWLSQFFGCVARSAMQADHNFASQINRTLLLMFLRKTCNQIGRRARTCLETVFFRDVSV